MVVILPVHAGVGADDRRAIVQAGTHAVLLYVSSTFSALYPFLS